MGELRIHSDKAWEIASHYSWALASSTRDLAAEIDLALNGRWQEVETAPTDGTPFLGIDPPTQPEVMHVENGQFYRLNSDMSVDECSAQFWMPLPAPPEQKEIE